MMTKSKPVLQYIILFILQAFNLVYNQCYTHIIYLSVLNVFLFIFFYSINFIKQYFYLFIFSFFFCVKCLHLYSSIIGQFNIYVYLFLCIFFKFVLCLSFLIFHQPLASQNVHQLVNYVLLLNIFISFVN